jgi:hypothetical protein
MKTVIALATSLLFGVFIYADYGITLSIMAGFFWGSLNLYFIKELLCEALISSPKNYIKLCLLALLKFPLLYVIGYVLLQFDWISPGYSFIGFLGVIAASTQKWFWYPLTKIKSGKAAS